MSPLAQTTPPSTELPAEIAAGALDLTAALLIMGVAALLALTVHLLVVRLVFRRRARIRERDVFGDELQARCRWPARATSTLVGALVGERIADLPAWLDGLLVQLLLIAVILAAAWWALAAAAAVEAAIRSGSDLAAADNREARQSLTRVVILRRAVSVLIVLVAAAAVLLTFDAARAIGASLLASAGVISIIAGVAAQSTLGNLVAGVQVAFTEILKIDDVVVVEGEWGNVEAIGLTNVVVRTWDRRRLILPTTYFTTTPFQNWTREASSQILGPIVWHVDHRTDVEAMRASFHRYVETHPLWDGDVAALQVIDTAPTTIEVRGIATAATAAQAWDLRCAIREAVLADLVADQPQALPRTRIVEGEA